MYIHGEFPNFFLPIGRVCGVEIPLTRWRKPAGSVLATWQFKPMTPELEEELVRLLADLLAAHLRAHPPTNHEEAPQATSYGGAWRPRRSGALTDALPGFMAAGVNFGGTTRRAAEKRARRSRPRRT